MLVLGWCFELFLFFCDYRCHCYNSSCCHRSGLTSSSLPCQTRFSYHNIANHNLLSPWPCYVQLCCLWHSSQPFWLHLHLHRSIPPIP